MRARLHHLARGGRAHQPPARGRRLRPRAAARRRHRDVDAARRRTPTSATYAAPTRPTTASTATTCRPPTSAASSTTCASAVVAFESVLDKCGRPAAARPTGWPAWCTALARFALRRAYRAYDRGRTDVVPVDELVAFAEECLPGLRGAARVPGAAAAGGGRSEDDAVSAAAGAGRPWPNAGGSGCGGSRGSAGGSDGHAPHRHRPPAPECRLSWRASGRSGHPARRTGRHRPDALRSRGGGEQRVGQPQARSGARRSRRQRRTGQRPAPGALAPGGGAAATRTSGVDPRLRVTIPLCLLDAGHMLA